MSTEEQNSTDKEITSTEKSRNSIKSSTDSKKKAAKSSTDSKKRAAKSSTVPLQAGTASRTVRKTVHKVEESEKKPTGLDVIKNDDMLYDYVSHMKSRHRDVVLDYFENGGDFDAAIAYAGYSTKPANIVTMRSKLLRRKDIRTCMAYMTRKVVNASNISKDHLINKLIDVLKKEPDPNSLKYSDHIKAISELSKLMGYAVTNVKMTGEINHTHELNEKQIEEIEKRFGIIKID